jgi:hypothetical protein
MAWRTAALLNARNQPACHHNHHHHNKAKAQAKRSISHHNEERLDSICSKWTSLAFE